MFIFDKRSRKFVFVVACCTAVEHDRKNASRARGSTQHIITIDMCQNAATKLIRVPVWITTSQ